MTVALAAAITVDVLCQRPLCRHQYIVCAAAAEHESLGPSKNSPHVIGGAKMRRCPSTWGVRPLCIFRCLICAALMAFPN